MSATVQVSDTAEPDLIDRIANDLPTEVRADYYREMRHCRTLPSNDEMLRILRAMQFLHILMVRVPGQITTEREKFQQLLTGALRTLHTTVESSVVYQGQLDQRIEQLPENIANGISPEVIAAAINESLRQCDRRYREDQLRCDRDDQAWRAGIVAYLSSGISVVAVRADKPGALDRHRIGFVTVSMV